MTLRLIDGMHALALDYDGFILDLWGVVHDGTAPFPGVLDCMGRLIEARKRVVLLSNAPRRSDDVVRRIAKIGVPAGLYHGVMSSGEEAWQHLARRDDPFYAPALSRSITSRSVGGCAGTASPTRRSMTAVSRSRGSPSAAAFWRSATACAPTSP